MRHLCFLLLLVCTSTAHAAKRPNFVWLISEDNSKHFMELFDEHGAKTPAIEKLAENGLIFDHAFSNSPVCSVARTTLITGCYGPRIGTQFHRRSVSVPMPPGLRMFPAYLREAGYYAANNRKKDYNAIEGEGVWDASGPKTSWRARKKDQPFFYKQSFGNTHESSLHFPRRVLENQKTKTDPDTVFVAPYHPSTPTFRYTYAYYHDRIQQVDAQIGEVVNRLEKDGLLEDTFVFYFGDHGGVLPRGKGYAYESGLHVPLVVRIPKNFAHLVDGKRGTRVNGFVSFIDFGPTLLNLAGLKVPEQVDGKPFLGAGISMSELNARDEAFGYADRFDEKYDLVRTLRKGKYKYMRNYQPFNFDGLQNNYRYIMLAYQEWRSLYKAGKLNDVQQQFFKPRAAEALYDIQADPHETKNLANEPALASVLQDLRQRLQSRVKQMPDLSFFPESYLVSDGFSAPVEFGQAQQQRISRLVDVADLSLSPFADAREKISAAFKSDDPFERYWALIACSAHGKRAKEFAKLAQVLANNDPNVLVRTRAAEFLGLNSLGDPVPTILDCVRKSSHPVETNLILNSLVVLRDSEPGYQFNISWDMLPDQSQRKNKRSDVARRMQYLLAP